MKKSLARWALVFLAHVLVVSPAGSAAKKPNQMAFRAFTVEGRHWEGPVRGPWEWSGDVTVRTSGMVMTCDRLKLWPPKGTGNPERVVASGNIRIEGRFRDADNAEWEVDGRTESVTYERQSESLVLEGSIALKATNLTAGGVLSVEAEKLAYDIKKQTFRLTRGDERVRVEWQEPESPKEAGGPPADEPTEESGGS